MAVELSVVGWVFGAELRVAIDAAARAGFGGLELDAFAPAAPLTELSGTGRRELLRLVESRGLRLRAVYAGRHDFTPDADVDHALSRIEAAVRAARELGCGVVTADIGALPRPPADIRPTPRPNPELAGLILLPDPVETAPPPPDPRSPADDAMEAAVDTALRELGGRIDKYGVMLAVRSELAPIATLHRVVTRAACPWFGISFDPVAAAGDDSGPDAALALVGDLIRHVRVRDGVIGQGGRGRPTVVGHGSVDWRRTTTDLDTAHAGPRRAPWVIDPAGLIDKPRGAIEALGYLTGL